MTPNLATLYLMIDLARLHAIPLFSDFTGAELTVIAQLASERAVSAGEALFKPGDARRTFVILLSGQAQILGVYGNEVQVFSILEPNDYIVEVALVDPTLKHEHSCQMLVDGSVLEVDGKLFADFRKRVPDRANRIYGKIILNLTDRLHHANNKLMTIYMTGKIAATYGNLDHLSDMLLDTVLGITQAKRALFATYSSLEDKVIIRDAKGYKNDQEIRNLQIRLNSDPILGTLYRVPRELSVNEEQYHQEKSLHTAYASRNMLGAPLVVRDRVIGAILLGDKEGHRTFSHNNEILLNIIARQIALLIVTAEMGEKV